MKKFIALALTLVLCVSLLSVTALADEVASLYINSAEADAGQTVTLYVGIANNPGVAGMQIKIAYDDTLLEKVSYTGSGMNGVGVWTIVNNAVWDHSADVAYNGQILALTFKVKDSAKVGDVANVSVSCTAGNTKGEYVIVGGTAGTVTVVCDHAWNDGVVTKEHTCTEDGEMLYTCTKCGATKTEAIAAAHTWETVWSFNADQHFHACAKCDATKDNDRHYMNIVDAQAPEGDRNGYYLWDCDICDYQWRETWYPDEEPKVGDIRPMMAMGAFAVLFTVAAAAYVFKRKVNV